MKRLLLAAFLLLSAVPLHAQQQPAPPQAPQAAPAQPPTQPSAQATDDPQTFNAFAVVVASATVVRSGEKQVVLAGSLSGPFFVETSEGPQHGGAVTCTVSARIDIANRRQIASGACTFNAHDGATAFGNWECEGYELVGCRGAFKLAGGTGRFEGISGDGRLLWRPTAQELTRQLDGSTVDNATGLLLWRDMKLAKN